MSRNCAIVLHAHVPWVRHPEVPHSLEEDWLHCSVLETHLPLLEMMHRLREENVPWKMTLNLSPPLLTMFQDRVMKRRTLAFLDRTLKLCRDEISRGHITGFTSVAKQYEERFRDLRMLFMDHWQGDLVRAYADLSNSGHLEITSSAATQGVLPLLMRVPETVQAQVRTGIRQFVKCFEKMPRGFWLPECAYAPALSKILREAGVEWTLVDEHGVTSAPNASSQFPHVPGVTQDGLVVFARDHASSSQVWNADEGYPGDDRYRDFMRDVGLEAPMEYLKEYLGDSDQRQFTGLKYFRASRNGSDSELYNSELAAKAVEEHSSHFLSSRGAQLAALEDSGVENPISVCAFDADLFGHWWFEGIGFLEKVFRKAADRTDFQFTTPGDYVSSISEAPLVAPVSSSWGEGGYFETWTSEENNWIFNEVQQRAETLARIVKMFEQNKADLTQKSVEHRKRCLQHMTRELLLAQASDWGFLLRNESSAEYAEKRVRQHLANFDETWEICTSFKNVERLSELELESPIFQDIPWNIFEPYQ